MKPIIGCEVYVAPGSHKTRGAEAERSNHLVLLCESNEGYHNLIQLVSTGFLDGFYYKPRIDHDLLAQAQQGPDRAFRLPARRSFRRAAGREDTKKRAKSAYRLRDIFGKGNFFLEVQDQGIEVEKRVNRGLVQLSRETGIPLVATNDCHYLTQSDAHAQEVLLCIQTGKTMSDTQRMKFATDQFYFKTARGNGPGIPRDSGRRLTHRRHRRTLQRAKSSASAIRSLNSRFPTGTRRTVISKKWSARDSQIRLPLLAQLARAGQLRKPLAEYESRLNGEIEMIKKMRFAGYFLIVWDFIHYARAQGVPVGPGRGSAAGSLVSYALQITDVDPLQYDLLFRALPESRAHFAARY